MMMLMGFFHVPNLVMTFTVCHGFSMALIEIDGEQLGLPSYIAW